MSDPADGDPTERFADAFVRFVRAFGLLDAERTPCGAAMSTAEAHALTTLRTGRVSQRALGEHLRLTKSTTSRLVDQLTARGWVDRAADPGDGRVQLVGLTDHGERVAADVARRRSERLAQLLARVPKAQRGTVVQSLHLLEEASRDLDRSGA